MTAITRPLRGTASPGRGTAPLRRGAGPAGRAARLLTGREDDPRWARPALLSLLALTAALYMVGLSRNGWANDFYAAAVQAGTKSWTAFFFGSFDASNFITVDKTPASLWVMELSARAFGLNSWSLLLPQAVAGVATAGLLYGTVRRWSGAAAGLIAAAVVASTPVAALMFRFDNPDALLVLLLTGAAYGTTRAIESGRTRWLVLAGTLLGFGFLTKMLQAFLVLPAFTLAYLVAGPPRLGRRVWQLLAGGAAMIAAAGWWVAIVSLTPASARPYIGGSTGNSVLQLALGYNGLGRLDGNETGSVGFGGGGPQFGGSTGLGRLFGAEMGGQASWLLPAALIGLVALVWLSWRAPRTDRTRAGALLWGGWLLVTGAVFSYMAGIIHPYYTVALAPAIGALTGMGAIALWRRRASIAARLTLAAGLALTAWWAYVLLDRTPTWLPWLRLVVMVAGLVAAAVLLAAGRADASAAHNSAAHNSAAHNSAAHSGPGRDGLVPAAVRSAVLPLALVAGLAGPLSYSLDTAAAAHTGAIPAAGPAAAGAGFGGPRGAAGGGGFGGPGTTPGAGGGPSRPGQPGGVSGSGVSGSGVGGSGLGGRAAAGGQGGAGAPGTAGTGGPGGLGGDTQVASALTTLIKQGAAGFRWAAATVGSESAAPLQLASGEPVMAIGGFNGTDAYPTLADFKHLVAAGEIHYFVGANRASFGGGSGQAAQVTSWVSSHFTARTVGGDTVYDLTSPRS
jgi:4-amino-4-deoxy-L-arabinose transferase-like glycosyltransferase